MTHFHPYLNQIKGKKKPKTKKKSRLKQAFSDSEKRRKTFLTFLDVIISKIVIILIRPDKYN